MKIVLVLLLFALLWIVFAPGSGVVALMSKRSELAKRQKETAQIQQQIEDLQSHIDRLQNDPLYLEDVARKDFGLLKKNERVYDFSTAKPDKKK